MDPFDDPVLELSMEEAVELRDCLGKRPMYSFNPSDFRHTLLCSISEARRTAAQEVGWPRPITLATVASSTCT